MDTKKRFILVGSMRTGSNLLNSLLNTYAGVACHGEILNSAFVGLLPEYHEKLGIAREDMEKRDSDLRGFLDRVWRETEAEIVGFHLFPRHAPEIARELLHDQGVKKVLLRRSLFHSFVSLEIARQTDVWRIKANTAETKDRIEKQRTKIEFDTEKFENYRNKINSFWADVLGILNKTGQTAHPVWYSGLNDVNKVNEVAAFIGSQEQKEVVKAATARQNPHRLDAKVANYEELVAYADSIGLSHQL